MSDAPMIAVTGTGRVSRPPDMATVSVGVNVVRRTVDEATSEVARLAERLIGAVKEAGIADAELQTSNYSVNAEYDHRRTPQTLVGYRANNTVTVTILDVDTVGHVLTATATAGGDAVTINQLAFGHSDPTAMLTEARQLAWADAEASARQLAELAGCELGAPRRIEEGTPSFPGGPSVLRVGAMADSMAAPVETGSIERTVDLSVQFELVSAEGVAS